jgi:hypothetical protein
LELFLCIRTTKDFDVSFGPWTLSLWAISLFILKIEGYGYESILSCLLTNIWYERYDVTAHTVHYNSSIHLSWLSSSTTWPLKMGPKRRYSATSLSRATSQKSEGLNYTVAEDWNLAWKDAFLLLILSDTKCIYNRRVSASKLDVSHFSRTGRFHKNHMLKCVYSSLESSHPFRAFVLISSYFVIWSNWVLMPSGRPLLWHWSFTTSRPDRSCRHFAHIQIWWRLIKLMSFVTDPWFSNQQHLPGRSGRGLS